MICLPAMLSRSCPWYYFLWVVVKGMRACSRDNSRFRGNIYIFEGDDFSWKRLHEGPASEADKMSSAVLVYKTAA